MTDGKPDEIDLLIIDELQRDAAQDIKALSKTVHRSNSAVHERIARLKAAGFIRQVVAIVDREKLGLPLLVAVHVKLEIQSQNSLEHYARLFTAMPEIQTCLHVSGGWDFILQVTAASPAAFYDFLMTRICGQPNIGQVESSFVLAECKGHGPLSFYSRS